MKQKMSETGRTKPEHKSGGSDYSCNVRLLCPDYYGPTHLSGSRQVPVAPGVAASTPATRANSQPRGAPGRAGRGGKTHMKTAFMNLCFSTNKCDGLGTQATGKLLQTKQKSNKL